MEFTPLERRVLDAALDNEEQIREILSYEQPEPSLQEVMEACRSIRQKVNNRGVDIASIMEDPKVAKDTVRNFLDENLGR